MSKIQMWFIKQAVTVAINMVLLEQMEISKFDYGHHSRVSGSTFYRNKMVCVL